MNSERVLVAGIGNIFLGDDGFGVEVVRRLGEVPLPASVRVADYGIRGVHLAYDLLDGKVDTLILVDALPLDEPPGTIGVVEVDLNGPQWTLGPGPGPAPAADAHGMDPETTLRLVRTLGVRLARVVVVGCQPGSVVEEMGLSDRVRAAVEPARDLVARMAREVAAGHEHHEEAGHQEVGADA
jgi:hydrogenase maturation protease